jgi:cytochrome c oxidase subunit II
MTMGRFFENLWFPLPQASTFAPKVDALYDFIYWSSVVMMVPTIAAMLYFAIKYRESKNKEPVPYIHGHAIFEWSVSVVLSIVFVVMFLWGLVGFREFYNVPEGAYEINVIGQQWLWQFQYANGKTSNELYVPHGQPVKLIMTSRDVIHGFFVPNFRIKYHVVPGMYTSVWFTTTKLGDHDIFCTQYCGTAHSDMITKVKVLEPEQFKAWLRGGDPEKVSLASVGQRLFKQRNCIACHTVDGSPGKVAPSVRGLFGRPVVLADGKQVVADENYIRESITNPLGKVVKGFRPIMPTFKGLLSEDDLNSLVAYMKSLKE